MLKKSSLREKALLILSESTHLDLKIAKSVLEEDIRPLIRLFSSSKLALQIVANCSRTSRATKCLKTIERSNLIEELVDMLCKKDDWFVSKAITCLGNFACEYPELQNEIRACGGIEDLTDVLRRFVSSWSTSLLEACLVTFENIIDNNERNRNAFVRVNGVNLLIRILSHDKIRDEIELMISCYQLFLRCMSEDGNTIRNILLTTTKREENTRWIRNIADTIVEKQNMKDDGVAADLALSVRKIVYLSSLSSLLLPYLQVVYTHTYV